MKLTKETDYAIRALNYLAHLTEPHADAKVIAGNQHIPESYIFKVLRKLTKAQIIESIRGANGGYRLKKSPQELTLLDLISAVEGPPILNGCLADSATCSVYLGCRSECHAHCELSRIQSILYAELSRKNLAELFEL